MYLEGIVSTCDGEVCRQRGFGAKRGEKFSFAQTELEIIRHPHGDAEWAGIPRSVVEDGNLS